jgi:hypothetical protein
MPAAAPAAEQSTPSEPEAELQTQCYLRVKNGTKEKLTVYLQYRTVTSANKFAWAPADPNDSDKALVYKLDPGEETSLGTKGERICASRVRIWAATESGMSWLDNKEEDLWLVPLADDNTYCYYAPQMEAYTVSFSE